ncbi:hypothetical protein VTN00DRAFT_10370 [Thermoascus crustaceus]|uniref:uncharacterized protein n=1 Tax=Thermoascus crustaceus TaxID=5088 RepID=UPI0037449781
MGNYPKSYRSRSGKSTCSSSAYSNVSEHSRSTAPTVYSDRPTLKHCDAVGPFQDVDVRDSTSTYASTVPSFEDVLEDPGYEVVEDRLETFPSTAIPSNPSAFAELFPSPRRLLVRHDDATVDGNMNLRVDTLLAHSRGYQQEVILFHLRMHDLHTRKFSFRRYCRDSGREICHSKRKPRQEATVQRPALRRSLSSALASLRPGSSGNAKQTTCLKRKDSGYKSGTDEDVCFDNEMSSCQQSTDLSDTILLEFSNYAHVEVKRQGTGASKRYEFEYWSTKYQWKREHRNDGEFTEVFYHLINTSTSKPVAHIVPEPLTPKEAVEEQSKGGWVPPSSMWISDPSIYERMHDVADVIVATGLIALVDDSIRRRWHSKRHVQLTLPRKSSFMKNVDHFGPKRLIDEVFHRRGSADPRQPSTRT